MNDLGQGVVVENNSGTNSRRVSLGGGGLIVDNNGRLSMGDGLVVDSNGRVSIGGGMITIEDAGELEDEDRLLGGEELDLEDDEIAALERELADSQ